MRLDLYMVQNGYADSRERAKRLILGGAVSLDGRVAKKPAEEIEGCVEILVREEKFVHCLDNTPGEIEEPVKILVTRNRTERPHGALLQPDTGIR